MQVNVSVDRPWIFRKHAILLMPIVRQAIRLRDALHNVRCTSTASGYVSYLRPQLEALPRQPQPTVNSEDGHKTLRIRQHGNKSLPLPPLLDPKAVAAKERYTAAKAVVKQEEQTEFQRQLAANPFAQALATPIRQCHHTRVRLPSHFLQPFSASISDEPLDTTTIGDKRRPSRPITVSIVPSPRHKLPRGSTLPSSTYVLSTRGTMQQLSKKRTWGRIADQRMQDQYARRIGKKDGKNVDIGREWIWDANMPDTVLAQLRQEVAKHLNIFLINQDYQGLAPLERGLYPEERDKIAAVLLSRSRINEEHITYSDNVPPYTPRYYLKDLLENQEGYRDMICRITEAEEEGVWMVFTTDDRRTVPLLLALHRLTLYLEAERPSDHRK